MTYKTWSFIFNFGSAPDDDSTINVIYLSLLLLLLSVLPQLSQEAVKNEDECLGKVAS